MLETLFGSVLTAGITAASFTVCLIAALALGALVAAVYMYKNTCTQSMAVTLALLPAMVQIIILLVNGNLGAGVAVSGAFGLVRFRSAPGSARDITCIFLAMTLGLATGMGYIGIAVMTGVVMCLLLLVYAAMSFGRKPEEEKELKITIPENLDYTGLFEDLFAEYTRSAELISVRTTGMGSLYNLHYHITLVSADIEKQFLDAIRCRNGNLDIVCGKVPQEPVGKTSFFPTSCVLTNAEHESSESFHAETFSLQKYPNRGTRPRFGWLCEAKPVKCALTREC